MKYKLLVLVISVIIFIMGIFFVYKSSNDYENVEEKAWQVICDGTSDDVIDMCPPNFFENLCEQVANSKNMSKSESETYIRNHIQKILNQVEIDDVDLYNYQVYDINDLPDDFYIDDIQELFDEFNYDCTISKVARVSVSYTYDNIFDDTYTDTNYLFKIGFKWYSFEILELICDS